MKAISFLLLAGLLSCGVETETLGDGGHEPARQLEETPEEGLSDPGEAKGGVCDMYGGSGPIELEDGTLMSPVPVECNPFYFYEGYPADRPELPEGPAQNYLVSQPI